MRKRGFYASLSLLFIFCIIIPTTAVYADSKGTVIIQDNEGLLSSQEEVLLEKDMLPISKYGGVAFISVRQFDMDTGKYAENEYRKLFGRDSGTLFLIDMGERNIWIFSDGAIYKTVTKAYANTITDNVYRYASRGEYYKCASEAFREISILLEGGKISQPMKHICNVIIALILAFLSNFIYLLIQRHKPAVSLKDAIAPMTSVVGVSVIARNLINTRRSRHVESSGGGGGSSGGGGGGGGGSSGGGGGHSF